MMKVVACEPDCEEAAGAKVEPSAAADSSFKRRALLIDMATSLWDNPTVLAISNAKYFVPRDHVNTKNAKLCCIVHWLLSASPADRCSASMTSEVEQD
eukprot:383039-Amphidinium_carterae.1